jgi:hypothetical protein
VAEIVSDPLDDGNFVTLSVSLGDGSGKAVARRDNVGYASVTSVAVNKHLSTAAYYGLS